MAKVLMVVAPQFRDPEYFVPKQILETAGHEITTASKETGQISGAEGGQTESQVRAAEADVNQFEAVIFVGGPGMVELVNDPDFVSLAQKFAQADKIISAICVAPTILANAGILKGKQATVWEGAADDLKNAGAQYTGQKVSIDGKIITADGPAAAEEFGKRLVEVLK